MSALLKNEMPELVARHYLPVVPVMDVVAPVETMQQAIDGLIDDFALLGEWTERYQYIIDNGRTLPPLPEGAQTDAHKLHGCQSQVWLVAFMQEGRLHIRATSDAAIVSGLIALLLRVYDGRSPAEIIATPASFLAQLGLDAHLSPTRRNGLAAMVTAIQTIAAHVENTHG